MSSFLSPLGFWLTLAGIIISALMQMFDFPKTLPNKPNWWRLLPITLAFFAAIVSRYANIDTNEKNQQRIDSMRIIASSLDSSKLVLQSQFKLVADSFGVVKKQLNELKPLPFKERLRQLLFGINPQILDGLRAGHIEMKIDVTAAEYGKLQDITKESEAKKYIVVKPPASTAYNTQLGWIYHGITLLLNPELVVK